MIHKSFYFSSYRERICLYSLVEVKLQLLRNTLGKTHSSHYWASSLSFLVDIFKLSSLEQLSEVAERSRFGKISDCFNLLHYF